MSISLARRKAEQLYHSGLRLFEQGRYNEALREFGHAQDAFRAIDVRGQAFLSHPLSNGISGLANALTSSGDCYRKLGDYKSAITCYETSLINAKFEKKRAFRAFNRKLKEDLSACYEEVAQRNTGLETDLTGRNHEIDTSFRFPYSLPPDIIPFARLYELSPERHRRYEHFYKRARRKDSEIRRQSKTIDDSTMKRMSIYVWTILFMIWSVYAMIAVEAFLHSK